MEPKAPLRPQSPPLKTITRRRREASSRSSASYNERSREIERVAAELFNLHGFHGTSLAAIAEALGTDRASLYYYVSDKRELYEKLVRGVAEAHVLSAERVLHREGAIVEKLRELIIALMTSYGANYPLLYVHMRENLSHLQNERSEWAAFMRNLNRRYENVFIKLIEAGIEAGTIRRIASPRVLAYGIIGMIGWTNRWFTPSKTPESAEAIGAAYAECIIGGTRRHAGQRRSGLKSMTRNG